MTTATSERAETREEADRRMCRVLAEELGAEFNDADSYGAWTLGEEDRYLAHAFPRMIDGVRVWMEQPWPLQVDRYPMAVYCLLCQAYNNGDLTVARRRR